MKTNDWLKLQQKHNVMRKSKHNYALLNAGLGNAAGYLQAIVFAVLVFGGAYESQAKIRAVIAYDSGEDFSRVLWDVAQSRKTNANFPFELLEARYTDASVLASRLRSYATNNEPLLVFGPAITDDLVAAEKLLHDLTNKILFVSPTISTSVDPNRTNLVGACVSDEERVRILASSRPALWNGMRAAFVGMKGAWGEQLYHQLATNESTLFKSLEPYLIGSTNELGKPVTYASVASECHKTRRPLVYVALKNSYEVRNFFLACEREIKPPFSYRPIVCLLSDYRFVERNHANPNYKDVEEQEAVDAGEVLDSSWCTTFAITMASESIVSGGEDLYERLNEDFFAVMEHLAPPGTTGTELFVKARSVFNDRDQARELLTGVRVRASQYYRALKQSEEDKVVLKAYVWSTKNWSLFKPSSWKERSWQPVRDLEYAIPYLFDSLQARIPWASGLWLFIAVVAAVTIGVGIEGWKRFVFIRRGFGSWFIRLCGLTVIIALLLVAIVFLCWTDAVSPHHFPAVLAVCFAPLAILPMLQNIAFTRVPGLKHAFEIPSDIVEGFLDLCFNSRAKKECERERAQLEHDFHMSGRPGEDYEIWLWDTWVTQIRLLGGSRGRRLFEKGVKNTSPWDANFSTRSRIDRLEAQLAYVRVVNRARLKLED
jgi:hypothetical protein